MEIQITRFVAWMTVLSSSLGFAVVGLVLAMVVVAFVAMIQARLNRRPCLGLICSMWNITRWVAISAAVTGIPVLVFVGQWIWNY